MKTLLTFLSCAVLIGTASAQVATETRQFLSQSLNQNRTVVVYKPNSCTSDSPCPVIVFLPGWGDPPNQYTFFSSVLSNLISTGEIRPIIVVVPDGSGGLYTASDYWDSETNGRYGTYIVKDVVDWISQQYPVRNGPQGQHLRKEWIVAGFSMGGGGSARLALSSPNVFCGFASFSGGLEFNRLREWFNYSNQFEHPDYNYAPPSLSSFYTYGIWQYSSVFSPDTAGPYHAQFPLQQGTGKVIDSVFARWLKASPVSLARRYFIENEHPADSMGIYIRVAPNDPIVGAYALSRDYRDTLNSWGIANNYGEHSFGHDFNGTLASSFLVWADTLFGRSVTSVAQEPKVVEQFALYQNYPNPFNPSTTIRYGLPNRSHVSLTVFNTLGQQVAVLENGEQEAGYHEVSFDASGLSSGVYFYRLRAGDFLQMKRLLLLR